jgi:hypothetical protein
MPTLSEQFQLSTRNTMVHEAPYDPSVRQRTDEEDDDLGLSEGENNDTAEMIREYPHIHRPAVPWHTELVLAQVNTSASLSSSLIGCLLFQGVMRRLCSGLAERSLRFLLSHEPFVKLTRLPHSQASGGISSASVSPSFCLA